MPMPAPAPDSIKTWCPAVVSSRTPAGTRPTRYSWTLISFGTPIRMATPAVSSSGNASLGGPERTLLVNCPHTAPSVAESVQKSALREGFLHQMELDRYDRAMLRLLQQD